MYKNKRPPVLRAVRVRDNMTLSRGSDGAAPPLSEDALLVGAPDAGWWSAAIPGTPRRGERVSVVDVYGMSMQECCLPVLRALESGGCRVADVSLSTQRMSAVLTEAADAAAILYAHFPFEI